MGKLLRKAIMARLELEVTLNKKKTIEKGDTYKK